MRIVVHGQQAFGKAVLEALLGGKAWCYGGNDAGYDNVEGMPTIQYGCERLAAMIAWAYWPNPANSMNPSALNMIPTVSPATFRAVLSAMLSPGYLLLPSTLANSGDPTAASLVPPN